MTDPRPDRDTKRDTKGSRRLWILASALGALGLAVVLLASWIAPSPAEAFRFAGAHARGGFGDHDRFDEDHLRFGASWILDRVDASDEQIDAVVAIASDAIEDLHALHADHEAAHAAFQAALLEPEVDRDAIEALRVEAMTKLDAASARLAVAIADAAEVLSTDQRAELAELHDELRRHRHGRHRWHR
ncbi:MAG: hypothetical protein QNK05_00345 [Myxococcota bacterium]|nr:hypothetical protein [Myxococcota bacterium]